MRSPSSSSSFSLLTSLLSHITLSLLLCLVLSSSSAPSLANPILSASSTAATPPPAASSPHSPHASSCDEATGHCICPHGARCEGAKCTKIQPGKTVIEPLISGYSLHLCPECKCVAHDGGRWHTPAESEEFCKNHHVFCSPNGWAWLNPQQPLLEGNEACARLEAAGIRSIAFAGDSFMRHAFEALTLTLTGNYESGALHPGHPECYGDAQFEEKNCRGFVQFNQHGLCGGRVTMQLFYGAWVSMQESFAHFDIVIWSCGAHPVNEDYTLRTGVYKADMVSDRYFKPVCEAGGWRRVSFLPQTERPGGLKKVWWVAQHSRMTIVNTVHPDQNEDIIEKYNEETSQILKHMCNIGTIDTWAFTNQLVHGIPSEAQKMTYDNEHWSRAVNLIKAQTILYTITAH